MNQLIGRLASSVVSERKGLNLSSGAQFAVLLLVKNFFQICARPYHCRHVYIYLRGCLHDTRATFAAKRVHYGSLSWLYIHDTTTKCHAGAFYPGVRLARFLYRGENFTPVRNLARVSLKR